MHRLHFPLHVLGIKFWRDKKLGKAIQCRFQVTLVDVEKIVGVLERCVGIVGTAALGDELSVITCG